MHAYETPTKPFGSRIRFLWFSGFSVSAFSVYPLLSMDDSNLLFGVGFRA